MLMPQIAALGQAAHVQIVSAFSVPEMGAPAADDGRGLPLGLDTPAMENGLAFVGPRNGFSCAIHHPSMFDNRTSIRIAYLIQSHYPPAVNPTVMAFDS